MVANRRQKKNYTNIPESRAPLDLVTLPPRLLLQLHRLTTARRVCATSLGPWLVSVLLIRLTAILVYGQFEVRGLWQICYGIFEM